MLWWFVKQKVRWPHEYVLASNSKEKILLTSSISQMDDWILLNYVRRVR